MKSRPAALRTLCLLAVLAVVFLPSPDLVQARTVSAGGSMTGVPALAAAIDEADLGFAVSFTQASVRRAGAGPALAPATALLTIMLVTVAALRPARTLRAARTPASPTLRGPPSS
ncbi:MAG TPA: hypothetical protein VHJ78_14030 [Actinomycetota bacterium]|nr:hypothetical protein [Actinomycetota bacterium]